jgi:hypothetical protein
VEFVVERVTPAPAETRYQIGSIEGGLIVAVKRKIEVFSRRLPGLSGDGGPGDAGGLPACDVSVLDMNDPG